MAVSVTAKVNGVNNNLGANGTITVAGLTTSGASMILIAVQIGNNSTSSVSSATVNGNPATRAVSQLLPDGFSNAETWYCWSPSALASVSVVVNFSNLAGAGCLVLVDEATGTDASSIGNISLTGSGTSGTTAASVTASANGSVPYGSSLNFGSADTAGANTSIVQQTNDAAGDFGASATNTQSTSSGTSYTITTTHTSQAWGRAVVEIKPAGTGVAPAVFPRQLAPFNMVGPGRFRAGPKLRTPSFAQSPLPSGQMSATVTVKFGGSSALTGAGAIAATATITFGGSTSPPVITRYPIVKSGRKMFDQQGAPFRFKGRTAWGLASLDAANRATFLDNTVGHGFNAIECQIPARLDAIHNRPFGGDGSIPFLNTLSGGTWTGTVTYGTINNEAPDFKTPNPTYWAFVDALVQDCYTRNIMLMVFPAYLGQGDGWLAELNANIAVNGDASINTYGAFVANRYKSFPNIVWMTAGDTASGFDAENDLIVGIQSVSGQASGPNFSSERFGGSISTDGSGALGASTTLNGAYDWATVTTQCQRAYSFASPVMPGYLLEEPYDEEGNDGTGVNPTFSTQPTRRYEWWGWLNAIGGYVAGNGFVWRFALASSGPGTDDYRLHLDTVQTQALGLLNAFIETWPNTNDLVPGGLGGMRTLVVSGAGTIDTGNFVCAAQTTDGTLMIGYTPPGGSGTFSLDLRSMAPRAIRARWWDPTAATFSTNGSAAGTFSLSNTASAQSFTSPGTNSGGDADWVLVLDAQLAYGAVPAAPFNVVGPGRRRSPAGAGKTRSFTATTATSSGAMSATANMAISGTAALAGAGAISATSTVTIGGTAGIVGAGALAASATIVVSGSALAAGAGALAASAPIAVSGAANLAGAGAMTATAALAAGGTANLAGAGSLSATSGLTVGGSAAAAAAGALAASAAVTIGGTAALGAGGALAAVAPIAFSGTAALSGSGPLAATATSVFSGSAGIAGTGALAATAAAAIAGTALLAGAGALAAVPTITFGGFANTAGGMTAFVAIAFGGTAALAGAGALAAIGGASVGGTAALGGKAAGAATAALSTGGTAQLSGVGALGAGATVVFGGTATLNGAQPNVGTIVFGGHGALVGVAALAAMGAIVFGGSAGAPAVPPSEFPLGRPTVAILIP